jgi:hypothetical protein
MYPDGLWRPEEGSPDCRRVALPVCERDQPPRPNATIDAIATFQLRQRDTLDFTIDMSAWLGANGNAQLTAASWAVASGSPKTPTMASNAFSPQGHVVVVLTAASDAQPGDAYWLDATISIGATQPTNVGDVAIPARTIVRRIYVVVAAG